MQFHPTHSIAGTPRTAARGGTLQDQRSQLTADNAIAASPAGKTSDSTAIDAGDQTGDRRGDGRQPHDTFQRGDQNVDVPAAVTSQATQAGNLDYQA